METDQGLNAITLEHLYIELEKPIYNVVYRWVWNAEDAQDIVQEAFIKLWKMRHKVAINTVRPLIYKIAINLASNQRRYKKIRNFLSLNAIFDKEDTKKSAENQLEDDQDQQRIRAAIKILPEHLKKVIMLCEFSELSYREVGTILKIPPGTVASRKHTAIKRLKKEFLVQSQSPATNNTDNNL